MSVTDYEAEVLLDFAAAYASTSGDSEACTCVACEAARIVAAPRRVSVIKFDGRWWAWAVDARGEPLFVLDRFGSDSWRHAQATASRHIRRARREVNR